MASPLKIKEFLQNSSVTNISMTVSEHYCRQKEPVQQEVPAAGCCYGVKDVTEAVNGEEGINMLSTKPDIVICDIHMSPVDGFNLLKHVRGLETSESKTPLIFLTGNANAEFVQKARNLTVDAYLLKPITADNLKSKIIALLTRQAD